MPLSLAGAIGEGKKPADQPIQQLTKFELVDQTSEPRAAGPTIPLFLLTRAVKVRFGHDDPFPGRRLRVC